MLKIKRCEKKREKSARYLSAKNVSGASWQKCGRVAVAESEYGQLLCRTCLEGEKEWKAQAEPEQEPVIWTGSGSLSTIKAGGEGFIWGTYAKAHPIPLYTKPQPLPTNWRDVVPEKMKLDLFGNEKSPDDAGYNECHDDFIAALEKLEKS